MMQSKRIYLNHLDLRGVNSYTTGEAVLTQLGLIKEGLAMPTIRQQMQIFRTMFLSDKPVLVDFWAEWCGPCKAIGPALEEIADSNAGQITIAKLNIDENPETPQAYNVRGIPTLLIFKDGEMVAEKIGAMPKSALEQWVADNL